MIRAVWIIILEMTALGAALSSGGCGKQPNDGVPSQGEPRTPAAEHGQTEGKANQTKRGVGEMSSRDNPLPRVPLASFLSDAVILGVRRHGTCFVNDNDFPSFDVATKWISRLDDRSLSRGVLVAKCEKVGPSDLSLSMEVLSRLAVEKNFNLYYHSPTSVAYGSQREDGTFETFSPGDYADWVVRSTKWDRPSTTTDKDGYEACKTLAEYLHRGNSDNSGDTNRYWQNGKVR